MPVTELRAQLKFSWSCTFHPSENADGSQLRADCSNDIVTDTLTASALMMNLVTPDEIRRGVARECRAGPRLERILAGLRVSDYKHGVARECCVSVRQTQRSPPSSFRT